MSLCIALTSASVHRQVPAELGAAYSDVFAPQDVATYGGLCALATFDRGELKRDVINNISFLEFLELAPEVEIGLRETISPRCPGAYAPPLVVNPFACHSCCSLLSRKIKVHLVFTPRPEEFHGCSPPSPVISSPPWLPARLCCATNAR